MIKHRFTQPLTKVARLRYCVVLTLLLLCCAATSLLTSSAWADTLDPETLATKIEPPNELGEQLSDNGVWSILDRTGKEAGYISVSYTHLTLPTTPYV